MSIAGVGDTTPTALPLAGSGPFSLLLALIGLVVASTGVVMRRLARRSTAGAEPRPAAA